MAEKEGQETASQKYRRKLKENPQRHAEHLRREKIRDAKRRALLQSQLEANEDLKNVARTQSRIRMQATRKRREELKIKQTGVVYRSTRTLGKAMAKVTRNLPTSPTKATEVVKNLAVAFKIAVPENNNYTERTRYSLTDEVQKKISDFYNRDDVSRQMPGIKDVKSVKSNSGSKIKKQKRTMVITINEAFEIFKSTYPEISLGRTSFFNERPANILPVSETSHNVCVCSVHSNFINLLCAISKYAKEFPKTHQEFLQQVSCSVTNEDCMSSNCNVCKESSIWNVTLDSNPKVSWKIWIIQNQRPKQVEISKPFVEALCELQDSTAKFKLHSFVKNAQSNYFQNAKQGLTSEKAIVQIDFAENYSLISQDEIQSAHWSHGQVTLFTCCIWTIDKTLSLVIVSDELSHNKYSVHFFLQKIFEYIKLTDENITSIYMFSDNCAAQFKNRYIMASLNAFKTEHKFTHIEWNFFAASHGKGAVDGIGGSVKRSVWIAVKSRKFIVNSAQDFYDLARRLSKNISFIFVSKDDIEKRKSILDVKWKGLNNIPGMQSKHYFQPEGPNSILVARTALSDLKCLVTLKPGTKKDSDWEDEDVEPLLNSKNDDASDNDLI